MCRIGGNYLARIFSFICLVTFQYVVYDTKSMMGGGGNVRYFSRGVNLCRAEPLPGYRRLALVHPPVNFSCKRLISTLHIKGCRSIVKERSGYSVLKNKKICCTAPKVNSALQGKVWFCFSWSYSVTIYNKTAPSQNPIPALTGTHFCLGSKSAQGNWTG